MGGELKVEEVLYMLINQSDFFNGINSTEVEFEYGDRKQKCYLCEDGGYYRIDHFSNHYVIEYAEDEDHAKNNNFEDGDLFLDSIPKKELIKSIQSAINENIASSIENDDFYRDIKRLASTIEMGGING